MNTNTAYKIVKLTNGDNLICEINDDSDNGEYILAPAQYVSHIMRIFISLATRIPQNEGLRRSRLMRLDVPCVAEPGWLFP